MSLNNHSRIVWSTVACTIISVSFFGCSPQNTPDPGSEVVIRVGDPNLNDMTVVFSSLHVDPRSRVHMQGRGLIDFSMWGGGQLALDYWMAAEIGRSGTTSGYGATFYAINAASQHDLVVWLNRVLPQISDLRADLSENILKERFPGNAADPVQSLEAKESSVLVNQESQSDFYGILIDREGTKIEIELVLTICAKTSLVLYSADLSIRNETANERYFPRWLKTE